jgi:uncharacterized repeat protein (TIGR03803 family)
MCKQRHLSGQRHGEPAQMFGSRNKQELPKMAAAILVSILCSGAALNSRLAAQSFSTLHSFGLLVNGTNSDGAGPSASLTGSETILYGTTVGGGMKGAGVVFAMNRDGSGYTVLHHFAGVDPLDGAAPQSSLVESRGVLYGTTSAGGSSDAGTVYALLTNGTGYSQLHDFAAYYSRPGEPLEGSWPRGKLTLGSNWLYGTTSSAGSAGDGTVFMVGTDGTGFRTLFAFNGGMDGAWPGDLLLQDDFLYGTAPGGSFGGAVFAIAITGGTFRTLCNFTDPTQGWSPRSGLALAGDKFYGANFFGGGSGWGAVFATTGDETHQLLHAFPDATYGVYGDNNQTQATNSEGVYPGGGLILSGSTLYGTTFTGGRFGNGVVFSLNTDGTRFTNLHTFGALTMNTNSDGAHPQAGLLVLGGTLYGTTTQGGAWGNGTLFSITLPGLSPKLNISRSGTDITLTWPTDSEGFTCYTCTNLSSATWVSVSAATVVINQQNTITTPILATPQFFRLGP